MRILIFIFSLFCLSVHLHAQETESYAPKLFKEIVANRKSHFTQTGKNTSSRYKQFMRWKDHYAKRLNEKGEVFNYNARNREAYLQLKSKKGNQNRSTHGYWISEGPDDYVTTVGWNGGNGRVNCMAFHPSHSNTIFVGTPFGGLWKTTNAASTWTPVSDGLCMIGITSIAFEGSSGDTMYIMTGQGNGEDLPSIGVLKSTDGGANWFETGLSWGPDELVFGYDVKVSPVYPHMVFASTSTGLFRTIDGGISWENVYPFRVFDVEFKPGSDSTIFIGTNHGGMRSDNLGASIVTTGLNTVNPGQQTWRVNFAVPNLNENPLQDSNLVYAIYGNWNRNQPGFFGLFRSLNGGQNFSLLSNTPNILGNSTTGGDNRNQADRDLSIAINPNNQDQVIAGGINVWFYDDQASTPWTILSHWNEDTAATIGYTHADISQLEIHNGILYCASDGGFYTSNDLGQTWLNRSAGLTIMQSYSFDIEHFTASGTRVTTGTQDNGSNHWNMSVQQAVHSRGGDGMATLLDPSNELRFYQCAQSTVYRTTDAGLSFDIISPDTNSANKYWFNDMIMDPLLPSRIYISSQGAIFRTDDFGSNWTNLSIPGLQTTARVTSLAQNGMNQNVLYVSNGSQLFRTSDATASPPGLSSWTNVALPIGLDTDATPVTDVIVDTDNVNRIWISLGGYTDGEKIYFTDQGDQALPLWNNLSGSLPNVPMHEMIYAPASDNGIYLGTEIGVYYREDTLGEWIYFGNGLPACAVYDLDIENGELYAATFGRGIWRSDLYSSCPATLSISPGNAPGNQSTGVQVHEATNSIQSTQVIAGGAGTNVLYQAGSGITLTPGFAARHASRFIARIGGCGE